MKKPIIIIVLMLFVFLLSGCYNYGRGARYGQVVDIKFYTLEYVEIEGEWVDQYGMSSELEPTNQSVRLNSMIIPINSPAPRNIYYVTGVEEGSTVIARIVIKPNNGYHFERIGINSNIFRSEDLYNVKEADEFIYLDFLCENIISDSRIYTIGYFYMTKEFSTGNKTELGSLFIEGRSYYGGFIFRLEEKPTI
jgi:predicted small secreted protein